LRLASARAISGEIDARSQDDADAAMSRLAARWME
jgi:hypothetical protein